MNNRYRSTGPALAAVLAWLCVLAVAAAPVRAQAPTRAAVDSLRAELARLRAQVDSLRGLIAAGATPAVEAEADSAEDALAAIRA
ncbi:MAG: hypothetical protein ACRELX_13855, partial [Longimicrobiales bacterium]